MSLRIHRSKRCRSHKWFARQFVIMLLFVTTGFSVSAQTGSHTITGRIYDGDLKEWIVGSAVRVLTPKDSALVKGATSDQNGRFSIEGVKSGNYIVQVSFLGFETFNKNISVGDKDVALGTITLVPASKLLNEVQVTGQATPMTLKQDTVQFNASAFKVSEGANVEDLLRRIPGIEIDDNGGITYNGEAISRLELDGKDFFSQTPTMATRNLPSNIVKNVQVVDKKSEQTRMGSMDDGSREKVLNLQLKEDKKSGFIGNVNLGYGTKERYKADAMGTYFTGANRYTLIANFNNIDGVRRGRGDRTSREIGLNTDNTFNKWNVTTDLSYDDRDNFTSTISNVENILKNNARNFEHSTSSNFNNRKQYEFGSRIKWDSGKGTILQIMPNVSYELNKSNSESTFDTKDAEGNQINAGTSHTENDSKSISAGAHVYASHTFNEKGRNIFGMFNFNYSNTDGNGLKNSITEFAALPQPDVVDQMTTNTERGLRYGIGLSYLEPFSDRWALQLNYRYNYNDRSSNQLAYNLDANGNYTELDSRYSRGSFNTSTDHRFGGQIRYMFMPKSFIYIGMDANPSTTHTITTDGVNETFNQTRTVWNYAPSLMLDFSPSESIRGRLNYSGRTGYPSMAQLNPVVIINSPLSVTKGNPDLLPSFTHNLRVNMEFNNREARTSFQIFGRGGITNNAVVAKRMTNVETGQSETTYENVDGVWNSWFGLSLSTPIGGAKSKWNSFTFANVMYNKNKGFVNGDLNVSDNLSPRLNQRFTWSGDNLQVTTGLMGSMSRIKNSISTSLNRTTYDYSVFNELVWQLPWDLSLSNRLSWQDAYGYNDEIKRNLLLWDMSLTWNFLKGKNASVQLSGYDLLGQRTTVSRSVTANAITDTQVNGVTSYVMLTFSYRFNSMGNGARMGGNQRGERDRGFGRGRGFGGGRGM